MDKLTDDDGDDQGYPRKQLGFTPSRTRLHANQKLGPQRRTQRVYVHILGSLRVSRSPESLFSLSRTHETPGAFFSLGGSKDDEEA